VLSNCGLTRISAPSTSTLVRTTGSVKRVPIAVRLDLRSIRFSKYGRQSLSVGVLDMRLKLCMLTSKEQPAPEKIPSGAHALRIHVGYGKHPATKKGCNLLGVDLVVLGFPAVNGFHVQSVAEHEGDPFPAAQISDPVPGEDALHRQRDILPVWTDGSEQSIGIRPIVPVQ